MKTKKKLFTTLGWIILIGVMIFFHDNFYVNGVVVVVLISMIYGPGIFLVWFRKLLMLLGGKLKKELVARTKKEKK